MSASFFGILLACAIGQADQLPPPPPPKSLFVQSGIVRTGQNGYEDYLVAADKLLLHPNKRALFDAYFRPRPSDALKAGRALLAGIPNVTADVMRGNAKPVRDPRTKIDVLTLFPEYASFKEVNRYLAAEIHVRLADGQSGMAADALIAGLLFNDNYGRGVLIANLVSIAGNAILFDTTGRLLAQFSVKDSRRIAAAIDSILGREPAIYRSLLAESEFIALPIEDVNLAELDPADLSDDSEWVTALRDVFAQIPAQQRRAALERAVEDIKRTLREDARLLLGPEKQWPTEAPIQDRSSLTGLLAEYLLPVMEQASQAAAVMRTRLRLLRLHMLISAYRWEHMTVPATLEQLGIPDRIHDPLTGEPFVYEPRDEGSYRLYSKGNAHTGEIEIIYHRPRIQNTDPRHH